MSPNDQIKLHEKLATLANLIRELRKELEKEKTERHEEEKDLRYEINVLKQELGQLKLGHTVTGSPILGPNKPNAIKGITNSNPKDSSVSNEQHVVNKSPDKSKKVPTAGLTSQQSGIKTHPKKPECDFCELF